MLAFVAGAALGLAPGIIIGMAGGVTIMLDIFDLGDTNDYHNDDAE